MNSYPVTFVSGDVEAAEKLRKAVKGFGSHVFRDDGVVVEWDTNLSSYPQKLDGVEIEGQAFVVNKVRYILQGDIEHYIALPGYVRRVVITLCSE